jgi:hypothetical protein
LLAHRGLWQNYGFRDGRPFAADHTDYGDYVEAPIGVRGLGILYNHTDLVVNSGDL